MSVLPYSQRPKSLAWPGNSIAILLLCISTWLVLTGTASAAAITFNTALPVSKDELLLREQLIIAQSSNEQTDLELTEVTAATVLGYGITSKWSVFGVLPVRFITRDFGAVDNHQAGLGDAMLFTRYEVWRADQQGRTMRLSPFAGVRVPTGEDGRTGDGSVDVFGGLIFTQASVDYVWDAQISYTENRQADGFTRGDIIAFNNSLQYRLLPGKITTDTKGFLFAVLELNAEQRGDNRIQSVSVQQSGGFQLSLTPGLQYTTRRWVADVAVQIPVINAGHVNGLKPDYSIFSSVRFNF